MSFLLDTDICSAYMRSNHAVSMRFVQYGGRLQISAVSLGELWTWVDRANAPARRLQTLLGLLKEVRVVAVDVARKFGELRAWQLDNGLKSPDLDFINGVTALARLNPGHAQRTGLRQHPRLDRRGLDGPLTEPKS